MLRRLYLRSLVIRHRARQRERAHGWLFPVLAPFMILVALGCTLMFPIVSHWGAVATIESHGGTLYYSRPAVMAVVPDTLLVRVDRVELNGNAIDDGVLAMVPRLRGVDQVYLGETSVTAEALSRFRHDYPHIRVY